MQVFIYCKITQLINFAVIKQLHTVASRWILLIYNILLYIVLIHPLYWIKYSLPLNMLNE